MDVNATLIGDIKARQAEIAFALAEGHAVNIESYHRLVGTYQGLAEALAMLEAILEHKDF